MFVVGMGRSGTSALTRVLSMCGAALPRRMLAPNFGNPTGYWEPELAVDLNERFLQAHASSWYDAGLRLQSATVQPAEREAFVAGAAAVLAEGFPGDRPIVVKDPRMSGLLPYWIEAAERSGFRVAFVHCFRWPGDVAASLQRRDGLDAAQSDALWLKYNLIVERDTRGYPRVFVAYDDLLLDWEREVQRCIAALDVPLAISRRSRTDAAAFLSADHRHHASGGADAVAAGAADPTVRTYRLLQDAQRSGAADAAAFDEALAAYAQAAEVQASA